MKIEEKAWKYWKVEKLFRLKIYLKNLEIINRKKELKNIERNRFLTLYFAS